MQSSNPALGVLSRSAGQINFGGEDAAATLSGTTTKSIVLVAITLVSGYFAMGYTADTILSGQGVPTLAMYGSIIAALVVAMITIFNPKASPITAPLYALFEGIGLGCLSMVFEFKYPGIVSTAVLSTFAVVFAMLLLWKTKLIVPTARFRAVITGAIGGICLLYIANMIFSLFGAHLLPQTGPLAIGVSLIVCTVAALSLILDFDGIEQAVDAGLPKYFEYYNAFSLLVTICWLYVEILRLLSNRE